MRNPVRLSVVMPTLGRPTLRRAVASVVSQLGAGDELLLVADGCQPGALLHAASVAGDTPGVRVAEHARFGSVFGNAQRDHALSLATGTHLLFLDDDDVYLPGALTLVRRELEGAPRRAHVFRMRYGPSHPLAGLILWDEPVWRSSNIGSPMVVLPRPKAGRLPVWMDYNCLGSVSDFGWLSAALGVKRLRWHDTVIAEVRP